MSKRKTGKDDSTPHENEELSANGKRDKKKQKKARREEMEAAKPQTEKKTHKRKRGDEEDEEDGTSGYNDRGPKDSIKQGAVSNKEDSKKKKKTSKKAKKAPSSEDEAEKSSESKSKKEKKASKKEKKEKKKSKKEKKAKKNKGTTAEEKEKASNGDSAKEKEVETGASSATSASSNGGASDQGGAAGWNNWEASSFGDDARKNKFLRLMGAKKTGDTPSQPPQKKGLFGSLRASTAAPEPSAIDSSTEQKITHDLTSQFQDALQRRNCRGGIGLDSGTKKSDRSAEPQPHPYTGGKAKLHIDDYPKSIKFDD